MTRKPNRAKRIINFLEARYPGWVPAIELEPIGGRCGWRTAVSEGRQLVKERGDDIENRTRTMAKHNAACNGPSNCICRPQTWLLSEYRLKRGAESSPTDSTKKSIRASEPSDARQRQDLREVPNEKAASDVHDLNSWSLR